MGFLVRHGRTKKVAHNYFLLAGLLVSKLDGSMIKYLVSMLLLVLVVAMMFFSGFRSVHSS